MKNLNYAEACVLLEAGKRVKRKNFIMCDYIYMWICEDCPTNAMFNGVSPKKGDIVKDNFAFPKSEIWAATDEDIIAEDYELFEPENC